MNAGFYFLSNKFQTPQKQSDNTKSYNLSRGYSSGKKHRNPIFGNSSFKSPENRSTINRSNGFFINQREQHIQFKRVISDDFCGCQNTLTPCIRIQQNYLKQISVRQLRNEYQKIFTVQNQVLVNCKKQLLGLLPAEYPQIYFAHLNNLMDKFGVKQMTSQSFLCLSWIHFHCKLQHITYFFYKDLKTSISGQKSFLDMLQISLLRENLQLSRETAQYLQYKLSLKQFLGRYQQSFGALLIPLSQYAKFLKIVKLKGMRKALVQLISLFMVRKKQQFYQMLKFWNLKQFSNLRSYSRYMNWDLFLQQIQAIT